MKPAHINIVIEKIVRAFHVWYRRYEVDIQMLFKRLAFYVHAYIYMYIHLYHKPTFLKSSANK